MKKILTLLLAGAFNLDLSFHGVSAMDTLSMIPDYELSEDDDSRISESVEDLDELMEARDLDEKFQKGFMAGDNIKIYGIIDLAKYYKNYNIHFRYNNIDYKISPDEYVENYSGYAIVIDDPEKFKREQYFNPRIWNAQNWNPKALNTSMNPLPIGDYSRSFNNSPWMESTGGTYPKRGQGYKLHVSALPETALPIAHAVLPILQKKNVPHKVMFDLGYMRYTYYLSQYTNPLYMMPDGRSSQAGKFIAIYPFDEAQAIAVIRKIHKVFKAMNYGPEHFVELPGDAQVGDTGGIFVRYGKFGDVQYKDVLPKNVAIVNKLDQSIDQEIIEQHLGYRLPNGMPDSRLYPWPDYMNNRLLYQGDFLDGLPVTWTNPRNPTHIITWANRPKCWAVLESEQQPQPR